MTARPTPPPRERTTIAVSDVQWLNGPGSRILAIATTTAFAKRKTTRFVVWIMTSSDFYAMEDMGVDSEPRFVLAHPGWRSVLANTLAASLESEIDGRDDSMNGPVN